MEFLKKLCSVNSVSGNEEKVAEIIKNEISEYVDEIYTDVMVNLIAVKKGSETSRKFMLAAHMDEIGVMVTFIDDKGYLRFTNLGGVKTDYLCGRAVIFDNGVKGIVFKEDNVELSKAKLGNFYIDIGAKGKEEAQKLVSVGQVGAFEGTFSKLGEKISSKALDDRVGCYVLTEVIKKLKNSPYECYFVFTVQEELGLRGAKTAAFTINPDYALAVDVTGTGDIKEAKPMAVELSKGAAIKVRDKGIISSRKMVSFLTTLAKENNIPYQMEVLDQGSTDAGEIHLSQGGVITGGVSIPTRYIHSPVEMCDVNDVDNCIKLVLCALTEDIDRVD